MSERVRFEDVGANRLSWETEIPEFSESEIARAAKARKYALASRFIDVSIIQPRGDTAVISAGDRTVGIVTRLVMCNAHLHLGLLPCGRAATKRIEGASRPYAACEECADTAYRTWRVPVLAVLNLRTAVTHA